MISFEQDFLVYNLSYSFKNTYRYITLHKVRNLNVKNLFMLECINIRYISPLLSDFNNHSILGVFLIVRLITGQFPYISKYKLTSTLKKNLIVCLFICH